MVPTLLRKLIDKFFIEHDWNIGIIDKPIEASLANDSFLDDIKWFPKSKKFFLADPFYLEETGTIYCEKFDFNKRYGEIVSISDFNDINSLRPTNIASDYHASYPFIIKNNHKIWCIPEWSIKKRVDLYEMVNNEFKLSKALINEDLVDATVLYHNNTYWLFCTKAHENYGKDQLHIYYSNELDGAWSSHPKNPVKTDPKSSRPAGAFFESNGVVYRPAQNCDSEYGKSITLNKIETLNTNEFKEVSVKELSADSLNSRKDGIHTINPYGNSKTIVDGKVKRFSFLKPFQLLKKQLTK